LHANFYIFFALGHRNDLRQILAECAFSPLLIDHRVQALSGPNVNCWWQHQPTFFCFEEKPAFALYAELQYTWALADAMLPVS
jgi:hypothetical protein